MFYRYPRDHFTKTLRHICKRLDQCCCKDVEWSEHHDSERFHATVTVQRLWVFGSYARGVLDCENLDLIAEISSPQVRNTTISRVFFGSPRDTTLTIGTPESFPYSFSPEGAVLLWSGSGCDWQSVLTGITPDPTAKPFSRPRNQLPLQYRQLADPDVVLERILKARDDGIIKWTFTELPPPLPGPAAGLAATTVLRAAHRQGKKCARVAPHVLAFMHERRDWFGERPESDGAVIRWGGCDIYLGRSHIPIEDLDDISTYEIDIVPYITQHGPNGIWSLSRGPGHPICQRLAGRDFFTFEGTDERQTIANLVYPGRPRLEAAWVGIFTSERLAQIWTRKVGRKDAHPIRLSDDNLLALLATADIVSVNDEPFCRTYRGTKVLGRATDPDSTATILNALAPCH